MNLLLVYCFLATYHFTFTIALPPKLLPLYEKIDLNENEALFLTCSLLSGSQVTFDWTHNGSKLSNSSSLLIESSPKGSSLTFRHVQKSNAGKYECRATNSQLESAVTKTQININGKVEFGLRNFKFRSVSGANGTKIEQFCRLVSSSNCLF